MKPVQYKYDSIISIAKPRGFKYPTFEHFDPQNHSGYGFFRTRDLNFWVLGPSGKAGSTAIPGPLKYVNNSPKPPKIAQKAIILHTLGVQVVTLPTERDIHYELT